MVDIANNVLKGRIPITKGTHKKLSKYKQSLRQLTKPRESLKSKEQLIVQKGGFLPFLAPLIPLIIKAATVAGPLIAKGALLGAAGTAAGKVVEAVAGGK